MYTSEKKHTCNCLVAALSHQPYLSYWRSGLPKNWLLIFLGWDVLARRSLLTCSWSIKCYKSSSSYRCWFLSKLVKTDSNNFTFQVNYRRTTCPINHALLSQNRVFGNLGGVIFFCRWHRVAQLEYDNWELCITATSEQYRLYFQVLGLFACLTDGDYGPNWHAACSRS